jgi:hypothetical protein
MRSKKLVIGLLLLLAVVFTTGTFAYWASGVTGNNGSATGTVAIGSGDAVTTTVSVGNESSVGPLVPSTQTGTNNVDLIFDVDWAGSGATGATGTLVVTVDSVEINSVDYSHLFTVDVTLEPSIVAGTSLPYTVNVLFSSEPADLTEYNAVATESVVVTLTFTVTAD